MTGNEAKVVIQSKGRTSGTRAAGEITAEMIVVKSAHVVSRMVDGEAVIVEPQKGLVNVISAVGSRIWELADGTRTAGEIARIIGAEYDVLPAVALNDTLAFLEDMASKELIHIQKAEVRDQKSEVGSRRSEVGIGFR